MKKYLILVAMAMVAALSIQIPAEAVSTVVIEKGPRIADVGSAPDISSDARRVGLARVTPTNQGQVTIQQKWDNGSWTTIEQANPGSDGFVEFNIGGGARVYRALYDGVTSNVVDGSGDLTPTLEDEFNSGTLDSTKWTATTSGYSDSKECAKQDPSAVTMSGSTMDVKALVDQPKATVNCDPDGAGGPTYSTYLNGRVVSDGEFENGWFVSRVLFHRWKGSHSSFWIRGDNYSETEVEVDIEEYFGSDRSVPGSNSNRMYHNIWYDFEDPDDGSCGTGCTKVEKYTPATYIDPDNWWDTYHVFALYREANRYHFFIDGDKVAASTVAVTTAPEFIVFTMNTSDFELDDMLDSDIGSYVMKVDWAKFYPES